MINLTCYIIVLIIIILFTIRVSISYIERKIEADRNNVIYFYLLLYVSFIIPIYHLKEHVLNDTLSLLSKISLYLDFVGVIILTIIIFLIRYKSPKAISSFNSLGLIIGIENQSEILNLKIEEQQYHAINKKGIELRGSLSQEESDKIFDDYKKYIGKGSWDDFKLFIMGENHPNAINWNYHNNYNILQFKPYIFNLLNEIVKNGIGLQMGYSYKDIGSFICKHFIFEKKGSKMNDDKKKRIETIGKRYKEWLFSDE